MAPREEGWPLLAGIGRWAPDPLRDPQRGRVPIAGRGDR